MKTYYYEDKNGEFFSEDKSRRFSRVSGRAAYKFLNSPEGKGRRFMLASDTEDGVTVYVEIPRDMISDIRTDERRKQYLRDCKNKYSNSASASQARIDIDNLIESRNDISAEEISNPESIHIHEQEIQQLKDSLKLLNEAEIDIINALYLQDEPISEREYARRKNIPQRTLNDQTRRILSKLKKFF